MQTPNGSERSTQLHIQVKESYQMLTYQLCACEISPDEM